MLTTSSYLVTDQMATNLDTLLKAKRIDDQFTQYFLYQILVGFQRPPLSSNR